jgi:exodeoxyribonuclease VII small subunit
MGNKCILIARKEELNMAKKQDKEVSFEETLKQLETIVAQLENGDLPLDEALNEFEKGIKLAKAGQKQLQQAEQRIQILLSENSDAELSEFSNDDNE